jgi:hypothetical protein
MHWFRKCQIIRPSKTYNNYTNSILAILEFKTWYNHLGNSLSDELVIHIQKSLHDNKMKIFHQSLQNAVKKAFVIKSFGFNVWN